jgi:predicted AAA+ superfamily ATPase
VFNSHSKTIEKYLTNGGFPGLFHVRDPKIRANILKNLIETILDRDLRLVYKTSLPYQEIFEYCSILAQAPLEIVRPTRLKSRLRMAESTQKHLLYALESIFLVRRIPIEGDYVGDLFWYEDQVERNHFMGQNKSDDADWITLVYRNLRAQFEYVVGNSATYFSYRTRGGAQIPLAIRTKDGVLGVYPIQSKNEFNLSLKRSAESFLKAYNHSKVIFVTREGNVCDAVNERIGIVPTQIALF